MQEQISVRDYEREIFHFLEDEQRFDLYMEENKDKKLVLDFPAQASESGPDPEQREEEVFDYLEEISGIFIEGEADLFLKNAAQVALLAFHYLRGGVSYLDILQEGNLGLLKAVERFGDSGFSDFENYGNFLIIREILLFIKRRITNVRFEFDSFFKKRREHLAAHALTEEGEEGNEEDGEGGKDHAGHGEEDRIRESERIIGEKTDFFRLKNRLSTLEIEVLALYFGFGKEKRYSVFEIEKILELQPGQGEEIFKQALSILSSPDERIFV
ncbi:MAG: RNA polymerase subunit sigma [Fusobacteriaceae bacterium]|jgi:RNA polymerase sigma factor (sigma-70 family)|nr:RNA polymerase subunit sigma [Fusobacteriaceae bacterium]